MITPREFWAITKQRPILTIFLLGLGGLIGWQVGLLL